MRKVQIFSSLPDADELAEKVRNLDRDAPGWRTLKHDNGAPKFSPNGMLLDEVGNRSIFDDLDE